MAIEITYTLGNRGIARFETKDTRADTASAYHASLDQSLEIQNAAAERQFYGRVATVNDRANLEPNYGVVSAVEGVDLTMAIDSRILVEQAYTAQSRKALVTAIVADKLAVFGITVDAAMTTGPTIAEFTFTGTVKEVFDQIATITGEIWRLTPSLVLEFFVPGTKTASYSLTSTNGKIVGGVKWVKTRKQTVNRLLLSYGGSQMVSKTWTVTGDGVEDTWTLDYPGAQDPTGRLIARPVVEDSFYGGPVPLGVVGIDPTNFYEFNPATNEIIRVAAAGPLQVGATASVEYSVQFPQIIEVSDSASIAANGPWDDIQSYDGTFDKDVALAEANRRLARYKSSPRTCSLKTREGLVLPGDVITLTIPERTISGSWLITAVTARSGIDMKFTYELTCVEGTEAQDSWIDQFKQITGGSGFGGGGGMTTTSPGYVGGLGGVGTAGTLPIWASATTFGDSLIRQGTGTP